MDRVWSRVHRLDVSMEYCPQCGKHYDIHDNYEGDFIFIVETKIVWSPSQKLFSETEIEANES